LFLILKTSLIDPRLLLILLPQICFWDCSIQHRCVQTINLSTIQCAR